jgi:hypothetical protein
MVPAPAQNTVTFFSHIPIFYQKAPTTAPMMQNGFRTDVILTDQIFGKVTTGGLLSIVNQ